MTSNASLQGQIDRHEILFGERYKEIERRLGGLEVAQMLNNAETAEILEIVRMGKAFFRVGLYIGNFLKWATPVAASVAALWTWLKG